MMLNPFKLFKKLGFFAFLGVVIFFMLLGPISFAYDINHIAPFFHRHTHIHFFKLWCMAGGFFFGEVAIPVAVLLLVLGGLGVL